MLGTDLCHNTYPAPGTQSTAFVVINISSCVSSTLEFPFVPLTMDPLVSLRTDTQPRDRRQICLQSFSAKAGLETSLGGLLTMCWVVCGNSVLLLGRWRKERLRPGDMVRGPNSVAWNLLML